MRTGKWYFEFLAKYCKPIIDSAREWAGKRKARCRSSVQEDITPKGDSGVVALRYMYSFCANTVANVFEHTEGVDILSMRVCVYLFSQSVRVCVSLPLLGICI